MKQIKLYFAGSVFLTIVFLFINYYLYVNKNEGYVYANSTYNSIYFDESNSSIIDVMQTNTDSIELIIEPQLSTKWDIRYDESFNYEILGNYPKLYLPNNGTNYVRKFEICSQDGFYFSIDIQRQNTSDIHIIRSSLPVTEIPSYDFLDFCDIEWISISERNSVKDILANELKIDTCSGTISKIKLITSHINQIAELNTGIALNFQWNDYSAKEIYDKSRVKENSLTCNEFSEIYYLFANLAGVQTRRVGVVGFANSDGTVKLSGHHFNESFIPEQNKWAFVDITSHKASVFNEFGEVLNTYDLFMANISGNYAGLTANVLVSDSVIEKPYTLVRENEEYYFNKDCIIQYKFGNDRFSLLNQIARYSFSPEPVLSLNYNNEKLLIKNFVLIFFVILLFIDIILFSLMICSKEHV